MKIIIDDKTQLKVTSEYYAILRQKKDKEVGFRWEEYMWYTSLEKLIEHLVRKRLQDKDLVVTMKEFLTHYKEVRREVMGVLKESGVA